MLQRPIPSADLTHLFAGGGDMGRRIAALGDADTPLGAVRTWPQALVGALRLMLPAGTGMALFWGPEHLAFCNDACVRLLGTDGAARPARPAREGWGESWRGLEPLLAQVHRTGQACSSPRRAIALDRDDASTNGHVGFSCSPVLLHDGSTGGVLCIVADAGARAHRPRGPVVERDRLDELFEHAPSFMALVRPPDHVVELANASLRGLLGERPLIGRTVADAAPELMRQGLGALLDDVASSGQSYRINDVRVLLQNLPGAATEKRRLDCICQPIVDDAGRVTSIFVEGIDMTERRRAEAALEASLDSLALATEAGGIGTWDYDLRGDRFACSGGVWALFGRDIGRLPTRQEFGDMVHPGDRGTVARAFSAAIDPAVRAPYEVEYRVIGATDGAVRWIAAKGHGIFEGGECVRAIGVVLDVTGRKLEAEALRESEARFRHLADGLPALVWLSDADGRIVFASQGFDTLLGVAPERLRAEGWAPLILPRDREFVARRIADMRADPQVFGGEQRVMARDGGERWFHGEVRPRYLSGAFLGFVGCAIDVTAAHIASAELEARVAERTAELTHQTAERRRVEETLHQMQRLEAIGQLTSGVAHDFNNLLTVVLGNVDMLAHAARQGTLDAGAVVRLDHVRIAAERGAMLTAQLLAFSRRQRLEAKVVDLNDTVTGLSALLGSTLGRSIAIRTRPADGVWPALVDPTQIELIILNLAINARDAMPGGGTLTVSTANVTRGEPERAEEPAAGDYVRVAVSDSGTGMTPEVLARAFEPFFTTKEVGKGSGLGLAQVYGFAKQSGGGVRIDTAEGSGTTVAVFLPRAPAAPRAVEQDAAVPQAGAPVAGRRVLVLDDEDAVRGVAADTLREAGCVVIEASDGASALRALAHEAGRGRPVDAVVADVAMPRMTGIEFGVRAQRRWPGLPILFVTGFADNDAVAAVPQERIVHKPYARDALVLELRRLLDR